MYLDIYSKIVSSEDVYSEHFFRNTVYSKGHFFNECLVEIDVDSEERPFENSFIFNAGGERARWIFETIPISNRVFQ